MMGSVTREHSLPVTWHSRRGDFVSLMTLYESNFIQLRQLAPDLESMRGMNVSVVAGESPLMLHILERGPYTTTFALTYLFESAAGVIADPDLRVRVYHDAAMAEAWGCARWHRHEVLATLRNELRAQLGDRWLRNMMLNKWIDYCLTLGHQHGWRPLS